MLKIARRLLNPPVFTNDEEKTDQARGTNTMGLACLGGGVYSPMMFAVAAITIVIGLLFDPRIGQVFLALNIHAGFAFALVQEGGKLVDRLFTYSPLATWFYFALSLVFIFWTMGLTVVRDALSQAQSRVESMMVLYDRLYRSDDFNALSIKDYLPPLLDQIVGVFPATCSVRVRTDLEDITLDSKTLSSLGIIVNELATNAMKYAFIGRSAGTICVAAKGEHGLVVLTFEDDGIGVPEGWKLEDSTGFGIQLVCLLIQQLKGSIAVDGGQGTRYTMKFAQASG